MSSKSESNNPNTSRLPTLLLLAVAVFGPPSVATLTFAHAVTQNPWLTALLVALYEVVVFVLSFVMKVWQKLENPLVEKIAEWVIRWCRGVFSSTERNYCQHIIYEHRVFDVKGLSTQTAHALELEQVFVEVCVDPKAPHQTSANPIALPETLRTGMHEIWDYLAPKSGFNRHLVIIGAPGSGKTTLLKHIALALVQRHHKQLQKRHRARIPHQLPILLFLRDHVKSLNENPVFSLVDAIQAHAQREWQQTIPSQWITQCLVNGSCLVLLDGLDEVADPMVRHRMVEWVQRQMNAYGRSRFLLTSRPHGYRDNPIEGVTVMEVRPFTPAQVEQFVYNWYRANELKSWGQDDPGVQMSARKGAQDLLQRLHYVPALLALAVNPLLLTMIATVHRYRSSLPGKRVALYAEICEVFLGKRQEARGVAQELTPAQKQQVLQPLAYYLMQKGTRDISLTEASEAITSALTLVSTTMQPKDFLEMVQNTSGLLLERDPGIYSFAHLTFQEYLAAVHIKETGLEDILVEQIGVTWWHETIRLYSAQADATNLILTCLANDRPSVSSLTLALECEQEALKLQVSARDQVKTLLDTGIEDSDPARRRLIAEALLMRRLRQMVHLYDDVYIDTSLISCAEYQVFLDEQRAKGKFCHPDHWDSFSFSSGQGHDPVLGIRPSDAINYCQWLTAREDGRWHYRLPSREEVVRLRTNKDVVVRLVGEIGYWLKTNDERGALGGEPLSLENKNHINAMIFDLDVPNHDVLSKITHDFIQARMDDLAQVVASLDRLLPGVGQLHVEIRRARQFYDRNGYLRQNIQKFRDEIRFLLDGIAQTATLRKAFQLFDHVLEETNRRVFEVTEYRNILEQVTTELESLIFTLQKPLLQGMHQISTIKETKSIIDIIDHISQRNYEIQHIALKSRMESEFLYKKHIDYLQALRVCSVECRNASEQIFGQLSLHDNKGDNEQIAQQFNLLNQHLGNSIQLSDRQAYMFKQFIVICDRFVYDVARAQNRTLAIVRSLKIVNSFDHISRTRLTKSSEEIVYAHDLVLDLDRALALDFNSDSKPETSLSSATLLDLGRADWGKQGSVSFMQLAKEKSDHQNQEIILLCKLIRYTVLYLIADLKNPANKPDTHKKRKASIFPIRRSISLKGNTYESVILKYLNVYIAFALLELRIEGKFPAREGILLVKERIKDYAGDRENLAR